MNVSTLEKDRVLFRDVCLDTLVYLDTPFSLSVYLQLEYNLAVESEVKIDQYLDPVVLQKDLQALALVKKNPWFFTHVPQEVLHNVAWQKFVQAEDQNRQTNDRFRSSRAKAPWAVYLHSARQFCERILGQCVAGDLDFSPGANTSLAGKDAHILGKLRTPPHCTSLAFASVIEGVLHDIPHYALACGLLMRDSTSVSLDTSKVEIHRGNVFTSVPKDWRTNRPICIEPHGNMLLQKAYGNRIKAKLKKFGRDLETAQELHGELARVSSINDSLATIDLASASDTISRELVREILPYEWFTTLDKLRCRITSYVPPFMHESFVHELINEKFSSMGNGFTFELETLLFLSLALAVREIHGNKSMVVSVYGDDIIVDKKLAEPLIKLLNFCGLSINKDKTFVTGPFKESCGHDYFNGTRVRPVFLKELPDNDTLQLVAFANRVRQIANCLGFGMFCDIGLRRAWRSVICRLPKDLRLFGPEELGDEVLLSSSGDIRSNSKERGSITRIRVYRKKPHRREFVRGSPHFVLCCALKGVDSSGVIARGVRYQVRVCKAVIVVKNTNVFDDSKGYHWL